MLKELIDKLIFAAPAPSYTARDLKGSLCWLPWNDAIPKPGDYSDGAAQHRRVSDSTGGGAPVPRTSAIPSSAWRKRCPVPESSSQVASSENQGIAKEMQPEKLASPSDAVKLWLPCLWLPSERSATVLLYFHANAEDLGLVHSALQHLQRQLQVSVLAVEYPGYGLLKADTKPSEEAICSAALVALRYLVDTVGLSYQQVMIIGRSLGSGPAVYLASRFPVGGLILVNALASIRAVAEAHLGSSVAAMAFHETFPNERRIQNVSCPVLFIHAASDKTVPTEHSSRLFERCRAARKLLVTPENMEHNSHLFADPSFLVVPAIHFFHFPCYQMEKPPTLPKQVFIPPASALSRPRSVGRVRAPWLCGGTKAECCRRSTDCDDIAVPLASEGHVDVTDGEDRMETGRTMISFHDV